MSPEAYLRSLQRTADFVELKEDEWLLDAGCGSGLLYPFLADRLVGGGRYLGMDILPAGLSSLKSRTNRLDSNSSIFRMQGDLSNELPLREASVSCVVAHFSVYTLSVEKDRKQVCREFWKVLKPGGLLILVNPTDSYDARQIIHSSLMQLQIEEKPWVVKKFGLYPLTFHLGLKHIERQLKAGRWHGYQPDELLGEVAQAGFSIEHSESVYGGSGFLVVGKKP